MVKVGRFAEALNQFQKALQTQKKILITAPGAADGDSIGSQLALQRMILQSYPQCEVTILNDEPLPPRYLFLPEVETVETPDSMASKKKEMKFDVAIVVDGGVDRAGRVKAVFDKSPVKVFIDHHVVSADYPYDIRIVEPTASSTTELIYHVSQTPIFNTTVDNVFSQHIYLGLIFDTGFFRHSNTTPELLELAARLLRTGFDFTRVGERGMLERSFPSLKLLSDILSKAEHASQGRVIYSVLTQDDLKRYNAQADDREGIIDHLFLVHGIEVAMLFFEQPDRKSTKVSLRSQGKVDVAKFARDLTVRGGGHHKAAGANIDKAIQETVPWVLELLNKELNKD